MKPLSEVLAPEETEATAEVETQESGETEETTETEATEQVETEAEGETETAPPAERNIGKEVDDLRGQLEDAAKREKAFQAKAQDEVRKRQALERQAEKADAYTEPDKAIQQAVDEARNETWSAIRLMQENNVRASHEDYDEKFTLFEKMAADNPALLTQANNEFDPARFIYQTASNHKQLEDMGDLGTFEERVRAEERTKVLAELETKQKEKAEQAITDAIPTTLSGATAAGGTGGKVYSGQTPLNKILGK